MFYRQKIGFYCKNKTRHIYTMYLQNAEFLNVAECGAYNYQWNLHG